jgi:hypothetical protein
MLTLHRFHQQILASRQYPHGTIIQSDLAGYRSAEPDHALGRQQSCRLSGTVFYRIL